MADHKYRLLLAGNHRLLQERLIQPATPGYAGIALGSAGALALITLLLSQFVITCMKMRYVGFMPAFPRAVRIHYAG